MQLHNWLSWTTITDVLVHHPKHKSIWLQRACLACLFIGGVYLWGQFLNWGRGPLNFHDWAAIFGPRLAVLKAAILSGELPLHSSAPVIEDGNTLRFLAIPDQILSPQILLLRWLDIGRFIQFQFWLMYALGFWGLLQIRRRFNLSLGAFTILFFLFNFNGQILAHASVGHANWGGYFLFPFFALLIFDSLEEKVGWRWVAKVAFLAFFIFLQGAYHQFVWLLFFLGFTIMINRRNFWMLVAAGFFAVMVSMVRILPAFLMIGAVKNEYVAGFPLVQSIWQYLYQLQIPYDYTVTSGLTNAIGTWEYTFYVGLLGALFIICFGIIRPVTNRVRGDIFKILLIPCLGMTILSMDRIYGILREVLPLPIFTGERVASRIFSLVFVFLLISAVVYFQQWLDKENLSLAEVGAILGLVLLGANDLHRNLVTWSVLNAAKYYPTEYFNPARFYPTNQPGDTGYLVLLSVGFIVSLASAAVLLLLAWRERRKAVKEQDNKAK